MTIKRKLSNEGKVLTIILDDKFDFAKVQNFREAYTQDTDLVEEVVIDLQHTLYMDSSALGMLINMQKTMQDKVQQFRIINSCPTVMKILTISRFDKKFTLS